CHHVENINALRFDPASLEGRFKRFARRSDERVPGEILGVPGLLADEHDLGLAGSFAEQRLRAALVEVARAVLLPGVPDGLEPWLLRDELRHRRPVAPRARVGPVAP